MAHALHADQGAPTWPLLALPRWLVKHAGKKVFLSSTTSRSITPEGRGLRGASHAHELRLFHPPAYVCNHNPTTKYLNNELSRRRANGRSPATRTGLDQECLLRALHHLTREPDASGRDFMPEPVRWTPPRSQV